MTDQEIFSKAWVYALSMKELAVDAEAKTCMYRTENGNRCLIGLFIPDAKYTPEMENTKVVDLCTTNKYMSIFFDIGLFDGTDARLHFLGDLQDCHDSGRVFTIEQMIGKLREFAEIYNLTIPE